MFLRKFPVLVLFVVIIVAAGCSRDGGGRVYIKNKGSDTMVVVAQAWAEAYKRVDGGVGVGVSGGGSGTGASALIDGTVDIANMSRSMKGEEMELARKNGTDPREHVVGYDALAVYVHKDNPIESITLGQLAEIFGEGGEIVSWSQLGIEVPGARGDKIIRISRQNNSGTYVYFREATLGKKRDYKSGSLDMHGSKDVVEKCSTIPASIGYSGLAFATDQVKMVPVRKAAGEAAVLPSLETAANRTYPIARPLFMYTVGAPEGKVKEYLDWIMGDAGQAIVVETGYAPIR